MYRWLLVDWKPAFFISGLFTTIGKLWCHSTIVRMEFHLLWIKGVKSWMDCGKLISERHNKSFCCHINHYDIGQYQHTKCVAAIHSFFQSISEWTLPQSVDRVSCLQIADSSWHTIWGGNVAVQSSGLTDTWKCCWYSWGGKCIVHDVGYGIHGSICHIRIEPVTISMKKHWVGIWLGITWQSSKQPSACFQNRREEALG